jgi:hypothetical protein
MRWLLKRKQGSVRICKAIKLAIYNKKPGRKKQLTVISGYGKITLVA